MKNWKRHPNFRYRNCQKRLPGLCKRTKFINPCEDGSHKCPTNSECIAGEGKEFSCKCPEGSWLNKDLSSLLNFDILFFWNCKEMIRKVNPYSSWIPVLISVRTDLHGASLTLVTNMDALTSTNARLGFKCKQTNLFYYFVKLTFICSFKLILCSNTNYLAGQEVVYYFSLK